MFAVFAPLRNSLIIDPVDVSNTRIKVPCQKTKHRTHVYYVTFLTTYKVSIKYIHAYTYVNDKHNSDIMRKS